MIKTIMGVLAGFFLCLSMNAYSAGDLSRVHSSIQGSASGNSVKAASYILTDIHVANYSNQIITVRVPGTGICDTVRPGKIDDIISDIYFDELPVMIYAQDGHLFFDEDVPNHATVEVRNLFAASSSDSANSKGQIQAIVKR